MKLIRFSIIAFVMVFSFQFAKAQSISINAHFGRPYHRVVYARGYYARPVYYGPDVYYGQPRYYATRYYDAPVYYHRYYRAPRYCRHW
ncbi:hypothetical protein SAMN05192574_101105 [Mucilaginibacter gossypiicola]|uniref:YXWGXW repeat-containing protein n=1 Tax=Mucilaginibacter gossypiicola TaxID=551995 RepID=A0A1H7ZP78_9SPHI|nr:hypothetical protein [Mucilaginibacter gossypiicola]SEM59358.1 hypothetical protein SAMN05192574_101105 [Mucilaginibacter gossypiicola]